MEKIDYRRKLKQLYQPSPNGVVQVDVPALNYLMIDGEGDPKEPPYAEAVEALFSLSYTLKFTIKKAPHAIDYAVMPLEGLWWADDMSTFSVEDKSNWKWTMMIMQPEFITAEMVESAIADLKLKKRLPALAGVRFETFSEGKCAQILHIGPFTEEGPAVEKVHRFIESRGALTGRHHEIYLSDIRKADPAKWKTIIRQPMR